MEKIPTAIPGCFEIKPRVFADDRGTFVKTFHRDTFSAWGFTADFAEQFFSTSRKGVLRGLHFQLPPAALTKLVTCVTGRILDAVVDLRTNSPTFGKHILIELTAEKNNMLYLPIGVAHGFYTLSDSATVLYSVSAVHSAPHDTGIHWNSAGIPWPDAKPITSPRDAAFTPLSQFKSPFLL